jgi:pyruvate ferredoxin oxidoreductase gamma subunit
MLRIRFHGRGGQGMKTASRILGTAAFLQGFYAQDSPVYGAERRGAPISAFTRFDKGPILERGAISSPDVVIIADESLLADPLVKPLQGISGIGAVLINSTRRAAELRNSYATSCRTLAYDFTGMALAQAESTAALSVALGAAAAKLTGLDESFVEKAVKEELEALSLESSRLAKNLALARSAFNAIPDAIDSSSTVSAVPSLIHVVTPTYQGPWSGTASVVSPPNTSLRRTGDWRVTRPIIDLNRCTHCWLCFVNCPDAGISLDANDVPRIDYSVCKGCLICMEVCPIHAIEPLRETEAR